MTAKKGNREFFEVYKLAQLKEEALAKERGSEEKPTEIDANVKAFPERLELAVKADVAPVKKYGPISWIKSTRRVSDAVIGEVDGLSEKIKSLRKEEVSIKQETIIIGAIAATFLSLACFFVGYKVGYNKGLVGDIEASKEAVVEGRMGQVNEEGRFVDIAPKTDGIENFGSNSNKGDLWTLRIISYKNIGDNLQKAKNLAGAIKNMMGYDAFVAKVGNELIVCVGRFDDAKNPDLIDLKIKISGLVYENKKQFKESYPVKLR